MERLLISIFLILILQNSVWASNTSKANMDRAQQHIQKAVLKLPTVRKIKGQFEDYIVRKSSISKETLTIIGSTALTAYKGEINTKVIRKMDIQVLGGTMRPDVAYDFRNNITSIITGINWSF